MNPDQSREAFYSEQAHASVKTMYPGAFRRILKEAESEYPPLAAGETFGVQLNHSANNGRNNQWVNVGYEVDLERGDEYNRVRLEVIDPLQLRLGKSALVDTIHLYQDDKVTIGSRRYPEFNNVAMGAVDFWLLKIEPRPSFLSNETLFSGLSVQNKDKRYGTTLYTNRDTDKNIFERYRRAQEEKRNQQSRQQRPRPRQTKVPLDTYRTEHTSITPEAMNELVRVVTEIVRTAPDTKTARLRFERAFHPDRHQDISSKESHERYLLASRIFTDLV